MALSEEDAKILLGIIHNTNFKGDSVETINKIMQKLKDLGGVNGEDQNNNG